MVGESSCPGLIDNLSQIPEADENVFILAFLTEWFSLKLLSGKSAKVARRLVDKYRIVKFRNANWIRGEVGRQETQSSFTKTSSSAEMPQTKVTKESSAVIIAPISAAKEEEKVAAVVPLSIPTGTSVPAPPAAASITAPSLHIEFDPDTF